MEGGTSLKVAYVLRNSLGDYPPCIAHVLMLNDLGVDVTVYCGSCTGAAADLLKDRGISVHELGVRRVLGGALGRVESYLKFRWRVLQSIGGDLESGSPVWFGTADSAMALVGRLGRARYVLSVLELYDTKRIYRTMLHLLAPRAAAVVACEIHRAWMMLQWWNLQRLPFVLPNKTYGHPRTRGLQPSHDDTGAAVGQLKGKTVVIYQGMIAPDRDLTLLARALARAANNYLLVLMGPERYEGVRRIQEIYGDTVYVGKFDAPRHLEVTSYAHIGVAYYDASTLNNIFCAPNKTYEYAGFGIPTLCNDVPGLVHTVGMSGAGVCVDFNDEESLCSALEEIERRHDELALGAKRFFDDVDSHKIMKAIVDQLRSGGI